jgi:thiosulfate reductase/polysulfide reductase chain A
MMHQTETVATRRRFLASTAAGGAVTTLAVTAGVDRAVTPIGQAEAQGVPGQTRIVKNICHQCPARCGIDVYVTNGRVHAIHGSTEHPIANGKLCPKGPLGAYILYDPDRFKGPMKRTNPRKGRNEDPQFVPISWEEALDTVAARLNALRDRGESHRFALLYGRGWGASCAGLQGTFGQL